MVISYNITIAVRLSEECCVKFITTVYWISHAAGFPISSEHRGLLYIFKSCSLFVVETVAASVAVVVASVVIIVGIFCCC